jgi:tetratricopeptide (TPR) repeat protein
MTLAVALSCSGCPIGVLPLRPELRAAAAQEDALALSDELERLIDEQNDTPSDREAAYQAIRQWPQKTAAYAFARAAIAGRLVQTKGLRGGYLVAEMEKWARISIGLNPKFRNGAARRMLGQLYVLAPASLLKHGDSEEGLTLLEKVVEDYPSDIENHLRLAEAFISLGDHESAVDALCRCRAHTDELRPESRRIFEKLVESVGKAELTCEESDRGDDED